MRRLAAYILVLSTLSACAWTPADRQTYFDQKELGTPSAENFRHCHGYGCKTIVDVSLTKDQWKPIEKIFRPTPKTPEAERERLQKAIGKLEQIVGKITNTEGDIAGTFRQLGDQQLDCVDESSNTTIYLTVMQEKGLIKFHDVLSPTVRLPFVNAGHWPHQTAVIKDRQSGVSYAVDSWFFNNGHDADIIELKQWMDGWKPKNTGDSWL